MDMRLDKVTCMLSLRFKEIHSLVLSDRDLDTIRTGDVGALKHYQFPGYGSAKSAIAVPIAGAITNAFVEEPEAAEARLPSTLLDQLAKEKDNASVVLSEVQGVTIKEVKRPLMTSARQALQMKLKTTKGNFTFVFAHTLPEEVQALEQALQEAKAG